LDQGSKYNPKVHHRKSIRLAGYDYSWEGMYFITICCHNQAHRFGHIENDAMVLNQLGEIADNEWIKLPTRFPNIELGAHQIMPNHMHGIVIINQVAKAGTYHVGAGLAPALDDHAKPPHLLKEPNPEIPIILGNIIGAYKSIVFNKCLEIFEKRNQRMGKFWQRNYFEHIIRNRDSFHLITEYIINNPTSWIKDKFYSDKL